jgi:uncharacterized protein with PIN domain
VILLDAFAVVALLADEPAGQDVAEMIDAGQCAVSAVNLVEAADVLERSHGITTAETRAAVTTLTDAPLQILDVDERRAWRAAEVRAGFYRRRGAEISVADCILLATARPGLDAIATPDPPVLRIAGQLGIDVIPLLDSSGRRPR